MHNNIGHPSNIDNLEYDDIPYIIPWQLSTQVSVQL